MVIPLTPKNKIDFLEYLSLQFFSLERKEPIRLRINASGGQEVQD